MRLLIDNVAVISWYFGSLPEMLPVTMLLLLLLLLLLPILTANVVDAEAAVTQVLFVTGAITSRP